MPKAKPWMMICDQIMPVTRTSRKYIVIRQVRADTISAKARRKRWVTLRMVGPALSSGHGADWRPRVVLPGGPAQRA